jgi:hypothetical protein
VWCCAVPVGYDRDEDGRLVPNDDADVIRRILTLRAEGVGFSEIAGQLPEVLVTHTKKRMRVRTRLTRSSVRRVVMNNAYRGSQRIPVKERQGEPRVLENNHPRLVTDDQWEAANAIRGNAPIRRGLSASVSLKGLVRCGICGRSMAVSPTGDRGRDSPTRAHVRGAVRWRWWSRRSSPQ